MTRSEVFYEGNLRCRARHVKSGEEIITDAPTDNHGKGEAFSPTDLVGTSLLTCMITVMAIKAENQGYDMGKVKGYVEKHMVGGPRRVQRLDVIIEFEDHRLSEPQRISLEHTALHCPVAVSLHPDIQQNTRFIYD